MSEEHQEPPSEAWLTPEEVAERLHVTTRTVRRWAAAGALPAKRLGPTGRTWRVHASALTLDRGHATPAA